MKNPLLGCLIPLLLLLPFQLYGAESGINGEDIYRGSSFCEESLSHQWPIVADGILYDVRMGYDPIDGHAPVIVRTPVNPDGSFKKNEDGKVNRSVKTLTVDDLTGALMASDKLVKKIMNLLILSAAKNDRPMAFVFIDINDLNRVNNFVNKQVDGDVYIRTVARAVRGVFNSSYGAETRRLWPKRKKNEDGRKDDRSDWVFRDGGDELVLLVSDVNSEQLIQIMQRIQKNLLVDSEIQTVFRRQRAHTQAQLDEVLKSYSKTVNLMVKHVLHKVHDSFEDIRAELEVLDITDESLLEYIRAVDTSRRLHPSISMGSAIITNKDTYESLKKKTSQQAYIVKSRYKQLMGLDREKYGVLKSRPTRDFSVENLMPEILLPLLN